jgi:hypothetical protein
MSPLSVATLGRVLAIAASVAVSACQSTSSSGAGALPPSTAPSLASNATTPLDTATSSSAPASTMPTASFTAPMTPQPTPKATAATVPGEPTGVTFKTDVVDLPQPTGTDEITYQVTHTVRLETPRTPEMEIRVYGVTKCLSEPANPSPGTSGPCLVEHTVLPPSVMALAATVPADDGEISWIAPRYWECAGPPVGPDDLDYEAIVIAAYNGAGHSIFTIAYAGEWWRAGPDEVIC